MSTAVENGPSVPRAYMNGTTNGTNGTTPNGTTPNGTTNGTATNGTNGALTWEQQFLPPPLQLDDRVRALKVNLTNIL